MSLIVVFSAYMFSILLIKNYCAIKTPHFRFKQWLKLMKTIPVIYGLTSFWPQNYSINFKVLHTLYYLTVYFFKRRAVNICNWVGSIYDMTT